eukprot:TRINITY_DN11382_c0_g4_i2.p1 TRINITY_DN11382_c0_g4~~TRINITY_DN11382_c0_g4_i2.p1  ORF type:complete len:3793 (+),score=824.17 TRINITY_DN11382_c0_g4_i2:147-11525(+)
MVRLEGQISPLTPEPPRSQRFVLGQIAECPQAELLEHLQNFKGQHWDRCTAVHWHPVLNRFDDILAAHVGPQKQLLRGVACASESQGASDVRLVQEVLRVLYEVLFHYQELKGAFASGDRLWALLECSDLLIVLGALQCLSVSPPGRQLRGTKGLAAERRLESLASCAVFPGSVRAACLVDAPVKDFSFEVPRCTGDSRDLTVLTVPVASAHLGTEALFRECVTTHDVPEAYHRCLQLALSMWCRSQTLEGRREVVAISLYALCNAVKYFGPGFLHQHLQKRPGLFAELCDLMQGLQLIGHEAGIAALRAIGAVLDSKFGPNRVEMIQLSQMLGLSVPHGIAACALRGLLSEEAPQDSLGNHYKLLVAALDLFQITTASNHQTTVQLGHAGMILAMLELMQKTDLISLPAVVAMLRCLELAAELSSATALVLFREFHGLQAFSSRLQQEVDFLMALDFQGDVYDANPPGTDAPEATRAHFWRVLEEITARRRLCRQLLKNIQVALQCSDAVRADLAHVFQGPLMEVLKTALREPQKVGLCLFGTAIDMVSNLIQDDPSRVPQMIDSGVLPGIVGALNKDTMRSAECISSVPSMLGSISLHSVSENFILQMPNRPVKLLTDLLVDPTFAPLLHSQPELTQIMSTHVDKILTNRPSGSTLREHVVVCILDTMRALLDQAQAYPVWSPTDLEDRTEFLADRLAAFARFCWSVLGSNEQTLALFIEKNGLALIREFHELPCLPYHLCSLEGQQHPLGSLFNLEAAGPASNTRVVSMLQEMLKKHHAHIVGFMQDHLRGAAEPYGILAKLDIAKVDGFLRALSGVTTILEGILAVLREGATVQVLESLQECMTMMKDIAPVLLALASWQPKEKDHKATQFSTYAELVRSVFTEKTEKPSEKVDDAMEVDGGDGAPIVAPMEVDGGAVAATAATSTSPMLHAARQCFRLSARTVRQFLVNTSKQLHGRTRQREVAPGILALARKLALVTKAVLSTERSSELSVALRWTGDVFDLLLRLHEEQNKVAVRPLSLCAFYQARGFPLVEPLLTFAADNLEHEAGPSALCSGLTYFEKVTSYKRFSSALQVNLLREEDGLITKDRLCRSVQGAALHSILPIWRRGDLNKFPRSAGPSLMKVWLHTLQEGPVDIPARPSPKRGPPTLQTEEAAPAPSPPAAGSPETATGTAATGAAAGAAAGPADAGNSLPPFMSDSTMQTIFSSLVDMGFPEDQVTRGLRELWPTGQLDTDTLITWMVTNPEPPAPEPTAPGVAATAAASDPSAATAPSGDGTAAAASGPEPMEQDVAMLGLGGLPPAVVATVPTVATEPEATTAVVGDDTWAKPTTTEEFQALVTDMLTDLLPRILAFGRQVPKAVPVVAETMAFIVALTTPLWKKEGNGEASGGASSQQSPPPPPPPPPKKGEENAVAVVKACLAEVGDGNAVPPPEALACVTQVLANLLHRRPQIVGAFGKSGMSDFLVMLHRWSVTSDMAPFARGYRTLCGSSAAPAPAGVGSPLVSPPAWLTPVVVCAHQLLSVVNLVQLQETTEVLSAEIQRDWVNAVLQIIYAYPGMDSLLALGCVQVLTRLCSTCIGVRAFLEYQPRLVLDSSCTDLTVPVESAGGLILMLRLARQASFPGLLQMVADFVLLLLEEGPVLQQRMESEILALFAQPQVTSLYARDISLRLFSLLSRSPDLFEEALKAVTQRTHDSISDQSFMLEPIPESERPQRPKLRGSVSLPPAALLVLQTLIAETCFGLEVQHRTTFPRIHEASTQTTEEGEEALQPGALPPPFPLALGPDSLLYILDYLLTRVPGLSALLLKQPPPQSLPPMQPFPMDTSEFFLVDDTALVPHRSMLLVMTRHLLPRFARLVERWAQQAEQLRPSQRAFLNQAGTSNTAHRCLPHLGACLCSTVRHAGEPRRVLTVEAIATLRALAEGPRDGSEKGSYGAHVATISALVARLLSTAVGGEKKDEKDSGGSAATEGGQHTPRHEDGGRPGTAGSAGESSVPPLGKRAKGKKDAAFFSGPGEMQVLRDAFVSILSHLDLYRSDSSVVAIAVVKCLEFLSRQEAKKEDAPQGSAAGVGTASVMMPEDAMDTEDGRFGGFEFRGGEGGAYGEEAEGDEQDDEDDQEEDDEDMGDEADAGLDDGEGLDAMDVRAEDPHHHEDGDGGEEDEEEYDEYDEDMDEDYGEDAGDDMGAGGVHAHHTLANILNAMHVFNQDGTDAENMTFRVDIDLGQAGVIHGMGRAGQFQQLRGPGGGRVGTAPTAAAAVAAAGGGWSEPGDLDVPADHPLLRREQQQQQNQNDQERRLLQLMPQLFGRQDAPNRAPQAARFEVPGETFDAAFNSLATRLRDQMRIGAPRATTAATQAGDAATASTAPAGQGSTIAADTSAAATAATAAAEGAAPAAGAVERSTNETPQESRAESVTGSAAVAVETQTDATSLGQTVQEAAAEIAPSQSQAAAVEPVPIPAEAITEDGDAASAMDVVAPPPTEDTVPPSAVASDVAVAAEVGEEPAATDAPPEPPTAVAEGAQEDPAAALGMVELARLAARLGCTQTEIMRAADIDVSVVAELPDDMRSAVVMSTISQVNLDHLRRPQPTASGGDGSAGGGSGDVTAGAFEEIDAAVLEVLPPEIREEVLREEAARRREAERAAQRAAAAETSAPANGGEMDYASFIASLDPVLREDVLMTAPEELLRTLPAELVAEAQLIQDRAFQRLAVRREAPPQPQTPPRAAAAAAAAAAAVRAPPNGPRAHQHLQAMEPASIARRPQGFHMGMPLGENILAQLGLQLSNQHNRQLVTVGLGGNMANSGQSGLSSFDEADRQLMGRLSDFDEGVTTEAPLPLMCIPNICRLLYLRQEVSSTPLTRLLFNLCLHPVTRSCTLGLFMVLLCRRPQAGSPQDALPPPHLFEGIEGGRALQVNPTEVQAVGSSRVLSLLAYILRRIPQCGEFFSKPMQQEKWMEPLQDMRGQHFINILLQLLTTKLFLSSSQHATWLLSILHALLVSQQSKTENSPQVGSIVDEAADPQSSAAAAAAAASGTRVAAAAPGAVAVSAPVVTDTPPAPASAQAVAPGPEAAPAPAESDANASEAAKPSTESPSMARWLRITKDLHAILSQQSVLALCNFLCQAGSGHGSNGQGGSFQMAAEILVALAASPAHLSMVRSELMRVLVSLVNDIEAALSKCEATTAEPSTMETRFLRVVRTLAEVFKEAAKSCPEEDVKIEGFLEEARIENLWGALDRTLERLDDTEVTATPAQRLLALGVAPSAVRAEGTSGLSAATSATLASNVQAVPPKPLLNRLLPLLEAFFVLHNGTAEEAAAENSSRSATPAPPPTASSATQDVATDDSSRAATPQQPPAVPSSTQVFADHAEASAVERSRFGQFCKKHRRPLNALVKQTPALLSRSFAPLLQHMPQCLDFDNKRAYFRTKLRSRRMESQYDIIRLRVRRNEIFMDSYHQLRMRTGEEMRAKIQVQFQGEEGIDAGGVAKEWYSALAKDIFNPNYALFVQAGGKACTYHPNPMSYFNGDHLLFFQFIGRVIGKAIHDGHNLEAWFTRGFYKHMLGRKVIPADLEAFDPEYFSNLKWMLDHDITDIVELFFSAESDELGSQKIVDLKPNGRNIGVTNANKHEYIQLMSEHKMTNSVRQQIDAFLKGLHEIVPPELLSLFDDKELELLISGLPDIDIEDLKANTEYHNYTPQADQVQWFWKVLSEFSQEQRAWFLQFATGTSRVPVEGFKGLIGMRGPQKFSIHRAFGADRLPSAHTCFNQVDLPEYPSEEILRDKLMQAVSEGHEGFGFA